MRVSGRWRTGARARGAWLAALAAVAGCGGDPLLEPGPVAASTRLELQSDPAATMDPATGKTTLVLEYLVRGADGAPADLTGAKVDRGMDGRPIDVESVVASTDTRLASSLTLGFVLDASYSMTTWSPPAFEPMKQAAASSRQAIADQFASWPGSRFESHLLWFEDQYLCTPQGSLPGDGILAIPTPTPDTSTKLLAATAAMVGQLKALYDAAPRTSADHFALVLFTDGFDNYSFHDDTAAPPKTIPVTGGSFACAGAARATSDGLLAAIAAFPQLRVHVIGLGNEIDGTQLSAIAAAGHGRFVSNADSARVAGLFQDITREFTTVRRDAVRLPLPPGDHVYDEAITAQGGAVVRVRVRLHVTDAAVQVTGVSFP